MASRTGGPYGGGSEKAGSMPATYDDAALIISMVRWETELGMAEAVSSIFSDSYFPETARPDDPHVRTVLQFGETLATLVKHGVLDRELVLDLWWIDRSLEAGWAARIARTRAGGRAAVVRELRGSCRFRPGLTKALSRDSAEAPWR